MGYENDRDYKREKRRRNTRQKGGGQDVDEQHQTMPNDVVSSCGGKRERTGAEMMTSNVQQCWSGTKREGGGYEREWGDVDEEHQTMLDSVVSVVGDGCDNCRCQIRL